MSFYLSEFIIDSIPWSHVIIIIIINIVIIIIIIIIMYIVLKIKNIKKK